MTPRLVRPSTDPSLRRFFSRPSESRSATYLSPSLFEHRLKWVDYDSVILQDFKSWTKIGVTIAYLSESDGHKSAKHSQHYQNAVDNQSTGRNRGPRLYHAEHKRQDRSSPGFSGQEARPLLLPQG